MCHFFDIDTSVTYTLYGENLDLKKGINEGWCVIENPPEFDAVNDSLLEPLLIDNYIIINLIKDTDQPEANNVNIVLKSIGGNGK